MKVGNGLSQGGTGKGRQKQQIQRVGQKWLCVPSPFPWLSRHSPSPRGAVSLLPGCCSKPLSDLLADIPVLLKICSLALTFMRLLPGVLKMKFLCRNTRCQHKSYNEKWGDSSLIYPFPRKVRLENGEHPLRQHKSTYISSLSSFPRSMDTRLAYTLWSAT